MFFDALAGVFGAGARAQDEGPVAGLRKQEFTAGLAQGARDHARGIGKTARQFGHARLRDLQMRINPFIAFVEPNFPIAFFAPA